MSLPRAIVPREAMRPRSTEIVVLPHMRHGPRAPSVEFRRPQTLIVEPLCDLRVAQAFIEHRTNTIEQLGRTWRRDGVRRSLDPVGCKNTWGAGRGPAAQSGLHRPVPRGPRRPPGWPRGYLPRRHLVVASFRWREVRPAGRHRPAELTNDSSRRLPRRLARDGLCLRRANVAALTSAVRRQTHVPT
jgi:hypothetical protein